ncbi:5-formyltetrahydrofolate cyclo-ligase [Arsenicibacter rosenii]|uniref:5-formyltetrahydrofolate cyclo-ligase n=1 Tax=Arsenicibacter rosenii TaxID=1750698 RepID=A0A1S2VFK7_9BACT|nr:5-formyltetrahydrofolate cyclo-ligase [Arsenicibacter rosenii]OIN56996.1 5-formyltetrahydrofolate cyclo-ligase [Arsenicibacter rosenii]
MHDSGHDKASLRKTYLARRKALSRDTVNAWSAQIAGTVMAQFPVWQQSFPEPVRVHCFLPITRQNEVDTWPVIRWLWQQPGAEVIVPVTDFGGGSLAHVRLQPDTPLITNAYGIQEPDLTHHKPVSPDALDVVLVPLLVADQQGQRVGYGGGFYDRFLAQCRPDCLKTGLSFFDPVERIADSFAGDIPLDSCIIRSHISYF